jgi:hypothetical protein
MFTNTDGEDWADLVKKTPRGFFEGLMRELYEGSDISEMAWLDDYELGFLTFLAGTHCCHLNLNDPPYWVVLRVCKLHWVSSA